MKNTKTLRTSKKSAVHDVKTTQKYLTFTLTSGLAVRLCHTGKYGWRLQTSADGKFDDNGAAQSLAAFMGEELKCAPKKLVYLKTKSSVNVIARDGSTAELSLGEEFSLVFKAPGFVAV